MSVERVPFGSDAHACVLTLDRPSAVAVFHPIRRPSSTGDKDDGT